MFGGPSKPPGPKPPTNQPEWGLRYTMESGMRDSLATQLLFSFMHIVDSVDSSKPRWLVEKWAMMNQGVYLCLHIPLKKWQMVPTIVALEFRFLYHYVRCIWGWFKRVPSQGYHHFPLWLITANNKLLKGLECLRRRGKWNPRGFFVTINSCIFWAHKVPPVGVSNPTYLTIVTSYHFRHHFILLMEEILHQLIGSLSNDLQGFIYPRWCRISSINSSWQLIQLYNPLLVAGDCRNEWDIQSCRQNFSDDFFEASFSKREGNGNLQGSFWDPFGGMKQCKCMVILRDFPKTCALFCLVSCNDPWSFSRFLEGLRDIKFWCHPFLPIQWYLRGYYLPILTQKLPLRKLIFWT